MKTESTLPIDYIAAKAQALWAHSHSRKLGDRLLRTIGAMKPAEVVYIEEYADGNWQRCQFTGEPVHTWQYSKSGLSACGTRSELDLSSAIASTTPVLRFHVDIQADRMIYQEWYGGRAGYGAILRRDPLRGTWEFERTCYRS